MSSDAADRVIQVGPGYNSIGVPRRYSYSPNEVVDLNDMVGAVRVLARFVRDMATHQDLELV